MEKTEDGAAAKGGLLGAGPVRLPGNGGAVGVEQVKEMVDRFPAAGVAHFGTERAHPGSDEAIRKARPEAEGVQLQPDCAGRESPSVRSRRCRGVAR